MKHAKLENPASPPGSPAGNLPGRLVAAPRLVTTGEGTARDHADAVAWAECFVAFIQEGAFPCVGAKSAIGRSQLTAYVGSSLCSAWDDVALAKNLVDFAFQYRRERAMFTTFVAIFPDTPPLTEEEFESAMWERLASLQSKDAWMGQTHDTAVSSDPASPDFSLSFGNEGFFAVGMHPAASRPARRFEVPAIVFNLHDQFERLRDEGRYEKLRQSILDRDESLAGSVNPMLARHGQESEARQYSGRIVGPDWECPWPGREEDGEAETSA